MNLGFEENVLSILRNQKRKPTHGNEFCTPDFFYESLDREFNFIYDAACTKENCKTKKGAFNKNSLENDWPHNGWIWLNPPYGNWKDWVKKVQNEAINGAKIVMLVPPVMICTRYFSEFLPKEIRFIVGRISFELDGKPIVGNMRDSALFIYDGYVHDVKCVWQQLSDFKLN